MVAWSGPLWERERRKERGERERDRKGERERRERGREEREVELGHTHTHSHTHTLTHTLTHTKHTLTHSKHKHTQSTNTHTQHSHNTHTHTHTHTHKLTRCCCLVSWWLFGTRLSRFVLLLPTDLSILTAHRWENLPRKFSKTRPATKSLFPFVLPCLLPSFRPTLLYFCLETTNAATHQPLLIQTLSFFSFFLQGQPWHGTTGSWPCG